MNTLSINLEQTNPLSGPACETCGGRTRLAGIEPHPRLGHTDIRTYECTDCEAVHAVVAPLPSRSINAIVLVEQPG